MSQLKESIERGKSQYGSYGDLAMAVGVPQQHLSMWKSGKRYCSPPDRAALAMAIGEDPAAAALEAVIEGMSLESPQGKRATHALHVALERIRKLYFSTKQYLMNGRQPHTLSLTPST